MMRQNYVVGIFAALASVLAGAQGTTPSFEVASVKVNTSGREDSTFVTRPDGVLVTNYQLQFIIARAYGISFSRWRQMLIGGSDDILAARFDIQAKAPQGASADEFPLMMRSLLGDRFQLRTHTEVRQTPVFVLSVARKGVLGPELRPSTIDCATFSAKLRAERGVPLGTPIGVPSPRDAKNRPLCWPDRLGEERPPSGAMRNRHAGPLAQLISAVEGVTGRAIVDETGLAGYFEWQLDYSPLSPLLMPPDAIVPSIFVAFEEQLGLKLQPATRPMDVLVIDKLEMPSPN